MKTWHISVLLLIIACFTIMYTIRSCPTCVGQVDADSPPIFSDELYQIQDTPLELGLSNTASSPSNNQENTQE